MQLERQRSEVRGCGRIVAIAITGLFSVTLAAQWPSFVRKDVPRTSEGKPDLDAAAAAIAQREDRLLWHVGESSFRRAAGSAGRWCRIFCRRDPPLANFANIGQNFKEGLPFTPWAAELRKQRMATNSKDNPDANCLPIGFMQLHTHSQPRKVVQTVNDLIIMYESNYGLRNIFTDGRSLPASDPQPWWYGYSVGKYDGDTLVVETIGLRDEGWLDVNGAPFTTRREDHRAIPAAYLWSNGNRHHDRRCKGVHAAVDRARQLAARRGRRTDRVRLQREQPRRQASSMKAKSLKLKVEK